MTNIISSSSISPLICFFVFFFWLGHGGALGIQHTAAAINGADKIRSQFLHLLCTRRSPQGQNLNPALNFTTISMIQLTLSVYVLKPRFSQLFFFLFCKFLVSLSVEPSKPVRHPLFQEVPTPTFSEVFSLPFKFFFYSRNGFVLSSLVIPNV